MSTENLTLESQDEINPCHQPDTEVSSTTITKRNQQVFTQQIIKKQIKTDNEISTNNENSLDDKNLVNVNNWTKSQVGVKRTTKTYCRKIIRKIGPDGEVSEEVIEGDDTTAGFLQPTQPTLENANLTNITVLPIDNDSINDKDENMKTFSKDISTNLAELPISLLENTVLSQEGNSDNVLFNCDKELMTANNLCQGDLKVSPGTAIVTRTFYGEKSATVTHSSTINGQTQSSSKSAFVTFSTGNVLEAELSINDMEKIFGQMTMEINCDSFDIFNQFLSASKKSTADHLALAGGDKEIFHFSFKPSKWKPRKSIKVPETIHDHMASLQDISGNDQHTEALIQKQIKIIKDSKSTNRLYWSNMEEVKSSGILNSMKKEEIHLQEAIFEVITSEASYNISLDTLIEFYYNNELLDPNKPDSVLNSVEKHHLFSNILLIKTVSLNLLKDLEKRWSSQKPRITELADIILKHAKDRRFQQQYINYLTNQSYQIDCLKSLLQKENFKEIIKNIQMNPLCYKLSLDSFLALPMQRLTRLKLLLEVIKKFMQQAEAVSQKLPSSVMENCQEALNELKELLTVSENNKFKMEQKERLIGLSKILEFSGPVKNIAIGSKELIKEGDVRASVSQISPNVLKKLSKKRQPSFYLIVLNDLVIITKKKSSTRLVVLEYCEKDKVDAYISQKSKKSSVSSNVSRSNQGSQSSMSSQISMPSNDSIFHTRMGYPFILKFNKEDDSVLTDPLVLTTTTIDLRDQWISAITSK